MNETFEALVKHQQETRVALETVASGSLQHRILDDTLHSANYALAQHAGEAVAEIARLREQVDTLTRERDAALAALKPFAEVWETWGYRVEETTNFVAWMHLSSQLGNVALRAAFEAAANALADGGE